MGGLRWACSVCVSLSGFHLYLHLCTMTSLLYADTKHSSTSNLPWNPQRSPYQIHKTKITVYLSTHNKLNCSTFAYHASYINRNNIFKKLRSIPGKMRTAVSYYNVCHVCSPGFYHKAPKPLL